MSIAVSAYVDVHMSVSQANTVLMEIRQDVREVSYSAILFRR
jgi:hypothetical protein